MQCIHLIRRRLSARKVTFRAGGRGGGLSTQGAPGGALRRLRGSPGILGPHHILQSPPDCSTPLRFRVSGSGSGVSGLRPTHDNTTQHGQRGGARCRAPTLDLQEGNPNVNFDQFPNFCQIMAWYSESEYQPLRLTFDSNAPPQVWRSLSLHVERPVWPYRALRWGNSGSCLDHFFGLVFDKGRNEFPRTTLEN